MKPLVAIVGRPNVGKSTLFNKILGRKKAIATDEPGVTRDLNFADVCEGHKNFTLVDTGGFDSEAESGITGRIKEQALVAIEDADAIIFVMDGRAGPTHEDREIVALLRKAAKPVFFAANKIDSLGGESALGEFYAMGIPSVYGISAEHGGGVYELLDDIIKGFPAEEAPEEVERVRVALVGRPNAGKSSILNRLIGRPRAIVSDLAGTTRDSVDTSVEIDGTHYTFVDTAGIRKKNRVSRTVETYCVMEAVRSIDKCNVACLVIDGADGVTAQDEKIAGLMERRGKSSVIVVNKWDIVEKDTHTTKKFTEAVARRIPFLSYAPVVFVSALTGKRVPNILEAALLVARQSNTRVTTNRLNNIFSEVTARNRPPIHRGRAVKFYYITQTGVRPPTFVIFANYPEGVPDSYRRYVMNSFRAALGMDNVPVRVFFRKRK